MPFQSEKQRRYLHANHPEIAKRWERDYATGGISNHFRKRFFTGAQADTSGPAGGQAMSPGTSTTGGTRHGGGGRNGGTGGGGPPVILNPPKGPTFAEIEAQKRVEAARLQALEDAKSKQMYDQTMAKRKKNIKYYAKNLKSKFDTSTWDTDEQSFQARNLMYNPNATLTDYYERLDASEDEEKEFNFFEKRHLKELELKQMIDFKEGLDRETLNEELGVEEEKDDTPGKFRERKSNWQWEGGKLAFAPGSKKDKKLRALDSERNSAKELGIPFSPKKEKQYQELLKEDKEQTDEPKSILVGAKGGVARKNYFHGGILDIDASEEIISDDGNDIELTAYNAAFDDPNDLSTGVKSLFQAKDGGTPQLAKKSKDGSRPGYGNPFGYEDAPAHHGDVAHGPGGRFDQPSGPVSKPQTVPEGINIHGDTGEEAYEMVGGQKLYESSWGTGADPREKYDTEKEMLTGIYGTTKKGINTKHAYTTGRTKAAYELALKNQKAKMKSMGKGKLIPALIAFVVSGFNPAAAMSTFKVSKIDMLNIVKDSIPVMKAKKAHITALEDAKKELLGLVDINNPNEMVNLEETTDFTKIMNELKDLTKPREQEDDDRGGPELPPQLGGPSTEEMAREYGMSNLEKIRATQALREQINPDWQLTAEAKELKNNPIVSGTETDIIAIGNKGGLANLFRVKNQ